MVRKMARVSTGLMGRAQVQVPIMIKPRVGFIMADPRGKWFGLGEAKEEVQPAGENRNVMFS